MTFLLQFLVVFKKFALAYLFQIALEIIWLPIQSAPQQREQNEAEIWSMALVRGWGIWIILLFRG